MTAKTAAAVSTALAPAKPLPANSLMVKVADKFGVDPDKMLDTLKATAFRGEAGKPVSNEQMMALLVVAYEYNLNPWLKEIYAFDDKKGGIVPMVPIDGWVRIINERPELKSIEFEYGQSEPDENGKTDPWIACTIARADRTKALTIREYLSECYRETGPWNSHPRRMLRHKALIQTARVAFGFGGIHDPDEGERILSAIDVTPRAGKPVTAAPRALEAPQPSPEPAAAPEAPDNRALDAEILAREQGEQKDATASA